MCETQAHATILASLAADDFARCPAELVQELVHHTRLLPGTSLWSVLSTQSQQDLYPTPETLPSILSQFRLLRLALASLRSVDAAGIQTQLSPSLTSDGVLWDTFLPLCLWLKNQSDLRQKGRLLVGICGPPGAGKTVLSAVLAFALNHLFALADEAVDGISCVFAFDAYHHPNAYLDSHFVDRDGAHVPMRQFKGDPISFDIPAFVHDLRRVKKETSQEVRLPVYDRRLHDPVADQLVVKPQHSFVLVEGMLLLHDEHGFEKIREYLDVCLFLEIDEDECHRRVVARKVLGGRDREDAERHYTRVDLPNVLRVNQRKERADLLLRLGSDGQILGARPGYGSLDCRV